MQIKNAFERAISGTVFKLDECKLVHTSKVCIQELTKGRCKLERRLAAVFAADVVGYSRLIRADESGTLTSLREAIKVVVNPAIAKHHGRVVKLMGDGVLAEFASAVDAVSAAVEIQRAISAWGNGFDEDRRITFRIGVNLGDVVIDGDDIQGDGVNVAARLESVAEPGAVCVSDAVHEQVRDRLDEVFANLGPRQLKNIDRLVQVWQWTDGPQSPKSSPVVDNVPAPESPSIAVLPFDNMSGDRDQDYFSDGITEDIITEISKIDGLLVISRNSTFAYKEKAINIRNVCRELGVRFVLEGSVRKVGERVRVTAQLIDGQTDTHIWAQRYDRNLTDVFAVQDDLTEKIASALEIKLSGANKTAIERKETENTKAYDLVLRGREQFRLYTHDGQLQARKLFEQARALDPKYAAAHAALALTALHEWFGGSPDALDQAYDCAQNAYSLDSTLPAVYEALASVYLVRGQHDKSVATARQWLQIEPGNAEAYASLAGTLLYSGATDEVMPLLEKAIRMNPYHPFYYTLYRGKAFFVMHRYNEALEDFERCISRNPEAIPQRIFRAAALGHLGRDIEARGAFEDVERMSPDISADMVRTLFKFKRKKDIDLVVEGLQKAGLKA